MRRLITRPAAEKLGFKGYDLMISREHPGRPDALDVFVNWVFRDDQIRVVRYPFRLPSWNLNGFTVYQITKSATES